MRAFPLIRSKWSNEHIMAALFFVILLYLLPRWIENPLDIAVFTAVLTFALILDETAGFIRHKRIICSVSAAVTAAIIHVITPGIPLWGKLLGVFAGIILGKQLWGGTGKNAVNPAIVGYAFIRILFAGSFTPIQPSELLIPAVVLSVPFILSRPYASLGYFIGILMAGLSGSISFGDQMIINSIFIGCIIMTDSVTVTSLKASGLAGGFICAFLPFLTKEPDIAIPLIILIFNLISHLLDEYFHYPRKHLFFAPVRLKKPYVNTNIPADVVDLSALKPYDSTYDQNKQSEFNDRVGICEANDNIKAMTPEHLITKLYDNGVYGMGGAAFPTGRKLQAILDSNVGEKSFIINAAECDPGLIHDKWLLHNRFEDILKGISVVTKSFSFSNVVIAVKGKFDIQPPEGIRIYKVKDYYPVGYENNLIKTILKKSVPSNFIPAKLGILVLNVQTVLSVYEAVCFNKKADCKYITVADIKNGACVVAKVRTGTPVIDAINTVYSHSPAVFIGGGLMQTRMAQDDDKIDNDTNLIAVASMPHYKESPLCSKCGACVSNCPKGLIVNKIADLVDKGSPEDAVKYSPELCIKCGLCSYVCLAGRNLSARVWEAKESAVVQ